MWSLENAPASSSSLNVEKVLATTVELDSRSGHEPVVVPVGSSDSV